MASQAAAAALPFLVRGEAGTIVCGKQSEGQRGPLLQQPVSCDALDGQADPNGNGSSSPITTRSFVLTQGLSYRWHLKVNAEIKQKTAVTLEHLPSPHDQMFFYSRSLSLHRWEEKEAQS